MIRLFPVTAVLFAAGLGLAACDNSNPNAPASPATSEPAVLDQKPGEAAPTASATAAAASDVACNVERGEATAQRLVERCLAVSTATRPPCNVTNPCALIEDEIKRACDAYGPTETKPAECAA